ncbi:MAG: 6-carboxytetrahydropterin synthase [Acidobacteriia bacterium]|nr:6-carboxytetrahydropterin synthase [Terriglobia bacterium]
MRLTRRYRFSASHRLDVPSLSVEDNRRLFGKCNNPWGHGHDYVVDVTVEGSPDASGQVVGRAALDGLVREKILDRFDHKNLNQDVAELAARVPTTENVAEAIREMLAKDWPLAARLARVRVAETDRNIFELEIR